MKELIDSAAPVSASDAIPHPASLGARVMTLLAILVPFAGVIAAPFYVWGWGFGWTDLALRSMSQQ